MISLLGLDPGTYAPSALHHRDRTFPETNCYVDIWIELLHAHGIDPASAMAFACTVDFEGDQWTFFKPPPDELVRLYGIDVHEMQLYRQVVDHAIEQLNAGRTVIIEADSFYMPDRAATSYRRAHVKSSIAIEAIDAAGERLRYFHGPGYYELSGDDYRGLFRFGRGFSEEVLPPYAELVRFDAGPRLEGEQLRRAAHEMLRRQLDRRPASNPWLAFGRRLSMDLPELLAGTDTDYHAYAFATVRQCGAAFEAAKSFVEWLAYLPSGHANTAMEALERQVRGVKALLFKLARRRAFDPAPAIRKLAEDWETAMQALECLAFGARRGAA
ncbi:MAG: hypothetical protein JWO19_3981 [Bryobacterales bacterium]|nr:hypothetical protein [Bryobacterales bacterium]